MRKLTFEEAFTLAVFVISLAALASPFITGEDSIASLLNNKLALIGATSLILLFIYKLSTLRKPQSTQNAPVLPAAPVALQASSPVDLKGNELRPANEDNEVRKSG